MIGPSPSRLLPLLAALCLAAPALLGCPPADPPEAEEIPPENGEEVEPECTEDDDCGDGDPCTVGACVEGACVFSRKEEAEPFVLGTVQTGAPALAVHLQGERWLHVATGAHGVETWDLRPLPDAPAELRRHRQTTGEALDVSQFRGHLFVSTGPHGIEVFPDDADEAVSRYRTVGDVRSALRVDDLVVASVGAKGLEIIDYADIAAPRRYSRVETAGRAERTVRSGSTLYVADGLGGVAEIDFRERSDPQLRKDRRIPTEGRVAAVSRRNELLVLAEWGVGLGIFDLDRRGEIDRAAVTPLGAPARALRTLSRHTALLAAEEAGLVIMDLLDPETPRLVDRLTFDAPVLDLDRNWVRVALALGEAGVAIVDLGCDPPEDEE